MTDEEIRRSLSRQDEDYKLLRDEHRRCEMRLQDLSEAMHLSEQEELEEKELKKRKLHLRDQMEDRVRAARARA